MDTKVSAIIPAYNAEKYLERAVRSLLETNQTGLEIIIVEDGSTDQTLEIAEILQRTDPEIIRIRQHPDGKNMGVSVSRNLGIESSNGEYICFLDADDYVYPHRFEKALQLLEQDHEADGVHELADMVYSNENAKKNWWKEESLFGFDQSISPENLLAVLLKGKCWATSAILVRKNIFNTCGTFEPLLKIAEDCHLWFRFALMAKLIPGDISQTVSAYWRHEESAYQVNPENRLKMIEAMSQFLSWANQNEISDDKLNKIRQAIVEYALNGIVHARGSSQKKLAWSIAGKSVTSVPSVLKERRFYSHLLRMSVGR